MISIKFSKDYNEMSAYIAISIIEEKYEVELLQTMYINLDIMPALIKLLSDKNYCINSIISDGSTITVSILKLLSCKVVYV